MYITNYVKWEDLEVALERQYSIDDQYQKSVNKEKECWTRIFICLLATTLSLAEGNNSFQESKFQYLGARHYVAPAVSPLTISYFKNPLRCMRIRLLCPSLPFIWRQHIFSLHTDH